MKKFFGLSVQFFIGSLGIQADMPGELSFRFIVVHKGATMVMVPGLLRLTVTWGNGEV